MQFKFKKLINIKKNIFFSFKILKFRRPKWNFLKRSFIFLYHRIFFFKLYRFSSVISWIYPFKEILNVFLAKRYYLKNFFKIQLDVKKRYSLFYSIKNIRFWKKNHIYNKLIKNRKFLFSSFELKSFILLYRIGWCLTIISSIKYIKNGFILLNNKILNNPHIVLNKGDLLSVKYDFYLFIFNEIKFRSSFFFIFYYNTFLDRRKPFIKKNFKRKYKTNFYFFLIKKNKVLFVRILFFSRLIKYFFYLNKKNVKFKKNKIIYYFLFNKILFNFFHVIKNIIFKKINKLIFNLNWNKFCIKLFQFIKLYFYTILLKKQLYKIKYFYIFKYIFFFDRYLFLFPHYIFSNYNTLELLVLNKNDKINYNKSYYLFFQKLGEV